MERRRCAKGGEGAGAGPEGEAVVEGGREVGVGSGGMRDVGVEGG